MAYRVNYLSISSCGAESIVSWRAATTSRTCVLILRVPDCIPSPGAHGRKIWIWRDGGRWAGEPVSHADWNRCGGCCDRVCGSGCAGASIWRRLAWRWRIGAYSFRYGIMKYHSSVYSTPWRTIEKVAVRGMPRRAHQRTRLLLLRFIFAWRIFCRTLPARTRLFFCTSGRNNGGAASASFSASTRGVSRERCRVGGAHGNISRAAALGHQRAEKKIAWRRRTSPSDRRSAPLRAHLR